jgi:hypothetical protein
MRSWCVRCLWCLDISHGISLTDQSNLEYILTSGASKTVAIALTYPYQVVRARIQVGTLGFIRCPSLILAERLTVSIPTSRYHTVRHRRYIPQ